MDVERILAQQSAMETRRGNWESLWEAVAQLVLPRSDDFRQKHSPGTQRNQHQYDSFPMMALDRFAAAIGAGTMPRTTYWHHMSSGDAELDSNHEVQLYLEAYNELLWRERYDPASNFTSQAHEKRLMKGAFGTGCLLVEARKGGGLKYKSIHLNELFIDENGDGMIDMVHRKFELTVRKAMQIFGKDAPKTIIDKYNKSKFEETFEFLHCVAPREDFEPGRLDHKGMPFAGYYVFPKDKAVVREEGFRSQPYIVSRHTKSTREIYGRGPAIMMLPDISMLNEMRRTTIEAANMAVDKPALLHDDVSEFDLTPGSRNLGTLDDNGRPLAVPYDANPRVDLGMDMIEDTRSQIDDGFLGTYFRVFFENPNMTATQAMLISQQQGQMTAPAVEREQHEWGGPMIRRESSILHAQGKLPEMPPVLAEFLQGGTGLDIKYSSPMVRQAQADESVGLLRAFESLAAPAQYKPEVYDVFDFAGVAEILTEVNGVPAKALKSKEQMAAEAEEKAAQQQMQNALDVAPVAADAAKKMAEVNAMSQAPAAMGGV